MERDQIEAIVVAHAKDVVEGLEDVEIDTGRPIVEYGAESLDILEVVGSSAREVGVKVAREELQGLKSIDDLVELYYDKQSAQPA
jgi:acyl carrier protein